MARIFNFLLVVTVFKLVSSDGNIELKFLKYINDGKGANGNCCDGWSICFSACDHYFTICVDDTTGSDHNMNSCPYGKQSTGPSEYMNSNTVSFLSAGGTLASPRVFTFNGAWSGSVKIKVDIKDHDDNKDDDVDLLSGVIVQKANLNAATARWHDFILMQRTRLEMAVRIYCSDNYYGESCNISCTPRDDDKGHYMCDSNGQVVCMDSYYGTSCTDFCAPRDDDMGHYECDAEGQRVCRKGWNDQNCSTDIDECSSNVTTDPCYPHGNCSNTDGGYNCICKDDYTGTHCDEIKKYCDIDTCVNNGTCTNELGGFSCNCTEYWTGLNCEQEVTACTSDPCMNNGTCVVTEDGFNCTCVEHYKGPLCQAYVLPAEPEGPKKTTTEDDVVIHLDGVLKDEDTTQLSNGLLLIIRKYGNILSEPLLEIEKKPFQDRKDRDLTRVHVTAISDDENITGKLKAIFKNTPDDELNQYLPLPLFTGQILPRPEASALLETPPSWIANNWYVVLVVVLVLVLLIIGTVMAIFFVKKRRGGRSKPGYPTSASGSVCGSVSEVSPDLMAVGFDNSLYFEVNDPEKISGLPSKKQSI